MGSCSPPCPPPPHFLPTFMMRMECKVIAVLDNQTIISQLLQPAGKVLDIDPRSFKVVAYNHFCTCLLAGNTTTNSLPERLMISCNIWHAGQFCLALISLTGDIPHGQRMDFFTLFIREQLYRLQIIRPALRLLYTLHFRAGQYQGNLLNLLIVGHIKISNSVLNARKKKNSTLTLHLSTFCFFYFIFILLIGGELLFKCPLLSTHSSDSPPVLSAFQKEGGDCPL